VLVPRPMNGSLQTIIASLDCGGAPVAGTPMSAVLNYMVTTGYCGARADATGSVRCKVEVTGAHTGFFVWIDVCFDYQGEPRCTRTGFDPA
jgi:hypothetical protein